MPSEKLSEMRAIIRPRLREDLTDKQKADLLAYFNRPLGQQDLAGLKDALASGYAPPLPAIPLEPPDAE